MINAVTGYGYTVEDLMEAGQRIWYLKRALGNLCGITREDDLLPQRIIEPHIEGSSSDLLRVLNPLVRVNEKLADLIKSDKILGYYKKFHARFILPNTYRTVNLTGKLIPSGRWRSRLRRADALAASASRVDFPFMLDEYYRLRRINDLGCPEQAVLEEYGLEDVSEALYGAGRAGAAHRG
jgi:aldehyde:ferredoxin oxidoreductase